MEVMLKEGALQMAPPTVGSSDASAETRKGAWCKEEDKLLGKCVEKYGEGNWHLVPKRAGKSPSVYVYSLI